MTKDPVCGMAIDETTASATVEYEGKVYYFCAPGCSRAFVREPEKYLSAQTSKSSPTADTADHRDMRA